MLLIHFPYCLIFDWEQNKAMRIRGEEGIDVALCGHTMLGGDSFALFPNDSEFFLDI